MGFSFESLKNKEDDLPPPIPKLEFGADQIFDSLAGETSEEYLSRTMLNVVDFYTKRSNSYNLYERVLKKNYYGRHADHSMADFFSHKINSQKLKDKLFELDNLEDKKFSDVKNRKIFDRLKISIRGANRDVLDSGKSEFMMGYFDNTNQRRDFFNTNRGKDAHSYVSMMFALPEAFVDTKEGQEYIHSLIDDKVIFLFGGGDSIRDLLKSEEFKPKEVINFDPFIKDETIDKNPNGIYRSFMISATDPKIREMVDKNEIPNADEVWATYSVPFYLDSSEEIKELINSMSLVLKEGGNARISPIAVQSKEKNGETLETRRRALIDSIKNLLDNQNYNVTIYNETLKIHKIKKESN